MNRPLRWCNMSVVRPRITGPTAVCSTILWLTPKKISKPPITGPLLRNPNRRFHTLWLFLGRYVLQQMCLYHAVPVGLYVYTNLLLYNILLQIHPVGVNRGWNVHAGHENSPPSDTPRLHCCGHHHPPQGVSPGAVSAHHLGFDERTHWRWTGNTKYVPALVSISSSFPCN